MLEAQGIGCFARVLKPFSAPTVDLPGAFAPLIVKLSRLTAALKVVTLKQSSLRVFRRCESVPQRAMKSVEPGRNDKFWRPSSTSTHALAPSTARCTAISSVA